MSILDKVDSDKPFFLYYGAKKAGESDSAPQSIGDADRAFGEVIAALKQRDLYDNTIIILIADNGESLPQGKCTLYRGGTNVPLIIGYADSLARGCVSHALVSSIDLAKTILDFAGLTPTKSMQGETLLPLLKGEKESVRKYAHAQMGWHFNPVAVTKNDMYFGRSVTDGETLLIYNAVPRPTMPYFEMYDLVNDKSQQTNIFGDEKYAAKRTELLRAMNRRMVLNGDFLAPPSEFLIIESNMGRKHLGEGNPIP